GLVDFEQAAWTARLSREVVQRQCLGCRREGIPETQDREEQYAVGQAPLRTTLEAVRPSIAGLGDEPKVGQRAVERVFGDVAPTGARRHVGAEENLHVALHRAFRHLLARQGLGPLEQRRGKRLAGELRVVEVTEGPEPSRRPCPAGGDLPVKYPERRVV